MLPRPGASWDMCGSVWREAFPDRADRYPSRLNRPEVLLFLRSWISSRSVLLQNSRIFPEIIVGAKAVSFAPDFVQRAGIAGAIGECEALAAVTARWPWEYLPLHIHSAEQARERSGLRVALGAFPSDLLSQCAGHPRKSSHTRCQISLCPDGKTRNGGLVGGRRYASGLCSWKTQRLPCPLVRKRHPFCRQAYLWS
jgi:hypothetical protein